LRKQLSGKINSWGIWWNLAVFKENGLVLYPRETLVTNIGRDGSGEHYRLHRNSYAVIVDSINHDFYPRSWPRNLIVNAGVFEATKKQLTKTSGNLATLRKHASSMLAKFIGS